MPVTHRGGGASVQKTLQGCAVNMGSKISLLVDEWPLTKCKWKFWKNRVILLKISPKIGPIGIWMSHFFFLYLNGSTFKPWAYYKGLSGNVPLKWVSKSASWYNDDTLLFSAKTGIKIGHIFKIF